MANIDATLDFMFSNPIDEHGRAIDLLYFADICGGPGGFSEYILWRRQWKAKGFGFTLRNDTDFNRRTFAAGRTETFSAFYGAKEDGNILDPENIQSLQDYVLSGTNGTGGVHFLMADAGTAMDEKNGQEIFYKNLYLCQCLAALSLVRTGGHCIVKLFDVFTPFSAGLVYLMHKSFHEITILKPHASRPGSLERFLIGKCKQPNTDTIRDHLFNVNLKIWNNGDASVDCREIVPFAVMQQDRNFFAYLCESNNAIGRSQLGSLREIIEFCRNKHRMESRQQEIRDKCLQAWKLPTELPNVKSSKSVDETFKQLIGHWLKVKEFMLCAERELSDTTDLFRIFKNRSDWFFVPIGTAEETNNCMRTFIISHGGYDVHYYSPNGTWKPLRKIAVEISARTLIYGEIVTEINADKSITVTVLHVIDGMVLGGTDIRHLPLQDRMKRCETFAKSLNKPSRLVDHCGERIATSPMSFKRLCPLNEFRSFFDRLSYCTLNDGRKRLGIKATSTTERWYVPGGLLFFNNMKPNIEKAFSRTHQREYFVDRSTGKSFFANQIKDPKAIFASFKSTFVNRWLWEWKLHRQVDGAVVAAEERINGFLYRGDLEELIYD